MKERYDDLLQELRGPSSSTSSAPLGSGPADDCCHHGGEVMFGIILLLLFLVSMYADQCKKGGGSPWK